MRVRFLSETPLLSRFADCQDVSRARHGAHIIIIIIVVIIIGVVFENCHL